MSQLLDNVLLSSLYFEEEDFNVRSMYVMLSPLPLPNTPPKRAPMFPPLFCTIYIFFPFLPSPSSISALSFHSPTYTLPPFAISPQFFLKYFRTFTPFTQPYHLLLLEFLIFLHLSSFWILLSLSFNFSPLNSLPSLLVLSLHQPSNLLLPKNPSSPSPTPLRLLRFLLFLSSPPNILLSIFLLFPPLTSFRSPHTRPPL